MTPPSHVRQTYINELRTGPKSPRDMSFSLAVTTEAVSHMMQKLREAGIVKSSRRAKVHGNTYLHELLPGWEAKMAEPSVPRMRPPTSNEELLHVAQLSDAGWMGARLYAEHRKMFDNGRPDSGIRRLKWIARQRGLCR